MVYMSLLFGGEKRINTLWNLTLDLRMKQRIISIYMIFGEHTFDLLTQCDPTEKLGGQSENWLRKWKTFSRKQTFWLLLFFKKSK